MAATMPPERAARWDTWASCVGGAGGGIKDDVDEESAVELEVAGRGPVDDGGGERVSEAGGTEVVMSGT
jgi:hypothetical protein